MIIKLMCKNCRCISEVSLERVNSNILCTCSSCGKVMDYSDSNRLNNLSELRSFDVVGICNDNQPDIHDAFFDNTIQRIKEAYYKSDNETQSSILDLLDKIYLIANGNTPNEVCDLSKIVDNYFIKSVKKRNEKFERKLLTEYDTEDFVSYIENIISGYKLTEKYKAKLKNMYRNYNEDYDFLTECVDISAEKYLQYDDDGKITLESANIFLDKIGGIAYNKSNE